MDYYEKYLKYKSKYLKLKKQSGGYLSDIAIPTTNLKTILQYLYSYMNTIDICFHSGTFIIEITNNAISNKLGDIWKNANPREVLGITQSQQITQRTHSFFKDIKEHKEQRVYIPGNHQDTPQSQNYTIYGGVSNEVCNLQFITYCKNTKTYTYTNKGVALLYPIIAKIDEIEYHYMFLKLEGSGITCGFKDIYGHSKQAQQRYFRKDEKDEKDKKNTSGSSLQNEIQLTGTHIQSEIKLDDTRREDCRLDYIKKNKEEKTLADTIKEYRSETMRIVSSDNYKILTKSYNSGNPNRETIMNKMDFYTTNIRTGKELFIPMELLLDIIHTPLEVPDIVTDDSITTSL